MKARLCIVLLTGLCLLTACNNGGNDTPPVEPDGTHNGYEYVDLGLSVKWAACNLGAATQNDHGNYYAWGHTGKTLDYTTDNCNSYDKAMDDIAGNGKHDAARALWGGSWRMPTAAETQELIDNCAIAWMTMDGVPGCLFISMKNGNRIFMPAAGFRRNLNVFEANQEAYYWSSTPTEDNKESYALYFDNEYPQRIAHLRNYGLPIRAVTP